MMKRLVALLLLTALSQAVTAEPIRPFVSGSFADIKRHHAGHKFLLALWSVDCIPCHEELALFGRLHREHPELRLVLISTDVEGDGGALAHALKRHGLANVEAWMFADDFSEKLRFEIDPRWSGELPRNYFVQANGNSRGQSGKVDAHTVKTWLRAN